MSDKWATTLLVISIVVVFIITAIGIVIHDLMKTGCI